MFLKVLVIQEKTNSIDKNYLKNEIYWIIITLVAGLVGTVDEAGFIKPDAQ